MDFKLISPLGRFSRIYRIVRIMKNLPMVGMDILIAGIQLPSYLPSLMKHVTLKRPIRRKKDPVTLVSDINIRPIAPSSVTHFIWVGHIVAVTRPIKNSVCACKAPVPDM